MSNDEIDASLGLAFSLELFKRYRKNGILQAEISRFPGIRKSCNAFLHLVDGEIVSIYLEDKQKQRYSSDKETLCRLDREKGPFEWTLIPAPAVPAQFSPTNQIQPQDQLSYPKQPYYTGQRSPILKIIAVFPHDLLSTWTPQQKDALYTLLMLINGERTIEDIKSTARLPVDLVDELLRILLELNVISVSTQ
ncbi:MAG: hypothetical protein ACRDHZ_24685 [Ktedonobacteraceae bacterium]